VVVQLVAAGSRLTLMPRHHGQVAVRVHVDLQLTAHHRHVVAWQKRAEEEEVTQGRDALRPVKVNSTHRDR